jgi:hypothetical protein
MEAVQARMLRWVRTRRGGATLAVATLAAIKSVIDSGLAAFPAGIIIYSAVAAGAVYVAARLWENKTWPGTPTFARPRGYSTQGRRLREDANAGLWRDRGGFLFEKRYFFMATGLPPVRLRPALVDRIQADKHAEPVAVATSGSRTWWAVGDAFFWENAGYKPQDVLALVRDRERRHERELDRAHMLMGAEAAREHKRERPNKAMRQEVFARDGGACVECGSTFDIQYDHIIPIALGGSNSVGNLQILCGECNRAKSASI